MTRLPLLALALALVLSIPALLPGNAEAQGRAYRGAHPVDLEGHWHLDDSVHVHDELAVGTAPFGDVDGVLIFLGDPLAYGWSQDVWTFAGAHPLPGGTRGYCGIPREHRHAFVPEGAFTRNARGVYRFTGAMRGGRRMVRPGRTAPSHSIVTAQAGNRPPYGVNTTPGIAPFWFDGCMFRLVLDGAGTPQRVPHQRCIPLSVGARRARGRRGRAPSPNTAGTVQSGRYGGFTTTRGRGRLAPRGMAAQRHKG